MADQEAALAANQRFYKLPDFWSASPAAWFGVVEAQFLLRGTEAQRDRFALVSAVLPEASWPTSSPLQATRATPTLRRPCWRRISSPLSRRRSAFSLPSRSVSAALQSFCRRCWSWFTQARRGLVSLPCCFCAACPGCPPPAHRGRPQGRAGASRESR